jgi:hypothetical protein
VLFTVFRRMTKNYSCQTPVIPPFVSVFVALALKRGKHFVFTSAAHNNEYPWRVIVGGNAQAVPCCLNEKRHRGLK